ncbi:MAG: 4Fe-4S binding protein [Deltaproteobacteria bacterium]|nr:4Fe-4S binding protein [Deltaproteobacteria bacterium]
MSRIDIDKELCKGCELCIRACPQGVLCTSKDINSKGYFPAMVSQPMQCIGCRVCVLV